MPTSTGTIPRIREGFCASIPRMGRRYPTPEPAMTEMSPAEEVFFAALDKRSVAEQAAYLDAACGGNPALRARVEKLLAAHPRVGDFLQPEPGERTRTLGDPTGPSETPVEVA